MTEERTITAGAAAALAGVHSVTIYSWIKKGLIQAEREGRGVMVVRASLEERLAAKPSTEEPELDRARAIVNGESDEVVDPENGEEEEAESFGEFEGLDENEVQNLKLRMAMRLTRHALVMRRKRQRDAERELLWLAVTEVSLIEASALEEEKESPI